MCRVFPCIDFDDNLYIKVFEIIKYEFNQNLKFQNGIKFVIK